MTNEVLGNVKRTEDSLLKLKRSRKSLIPETTDGLSDDNKIRLQVAIDIEQFSKQVTFLINNLDECLVSYACRHTNFWVELRHCHHWQP